MRILFERSEKKTTANIVICHDPEELEKLGINDEDLLSFLKEKYEAGQKTQMLRSTAGTHFFIFLSKEKNHDAQTEEARQATAATVNDLKNDKHTAVSLLAADKEKILAAAEGLSLGAYEFLNYKSESKEEQVLTLHFSPKLVSEEDLNRLRIISESVKEARDLVNEPFSNGKTAPEFSRKLQVLSERYGFSLKVLHKEEIESLKMGGLLGVNRASAYPPTFNILEYKSEEARNEKPVVLVGKGVVFDSGGANIKHIWQYMRLMKSDMGGAAAVAGTLCALAAGKAPVHVIGLIPCTDNMVNERAMMPGDVLTMHSGKTVEIAHTDAEGRLILADALHYAKQFDPELVIDLATLTGSSVATIGDEGIIGFSNASEEVWTKLTESGNRVYERLVRLPLWEEYGEMLKSDVADISNLGGDGSTAGAITAAKFLEVFTDYPWVHFDIAGAAFIDRDKGYRKKGGTGSGVRLLFDFLTKQL